MTSSDNKPGWFKSLWALPQRVMVMFVGWLVTASEWFERQWQRGDNTVDKISQSFFAANSFFARISWWFASPFVWLWRYVIEPVGSRLLDNPVFRFFGKATYWLWYPLLATATFTQEFLVSRSRKLLTWSLPVVMVLGSVALVFWLFGGDQSQRYRQARQEAVARGQLPAARLFQQKLQSLSATSIYAELLEIQQLADAGKMKEALLLASQLAPLDKPGFPEIHFWLAQQYITGNTGVRDAEAVRLTERHLGLLKGSLPQGDDRRQLPNEVLLVEALLAFKKGNIDRGFDLLQSASPNFAAGIILQLESNLNLGRTDEALQNALQLHRIVHVNPGVLKDFSEPLFPVWCSVLANAGQHNELRSAVNLWYQTWPNSTAAGTELSRIELTEVDTLMVRGGQSDLIRATEILSGVSRRLGSQGHPILGGWLTSRLPPTHQEVNFVRLAEAVADQPYITGTLLEILGTAATLRGEHERAIELLKRAVEKEPENAIAWNNMAYIYHASLNDLDHALEAVEKAIKLNPDSADIRHTRGMIYIDLKQWDRAIDDLKIVLSLDPNAENVHQKLAEAYRETGRAELASFHEGLAK